MLWTVFGPTTAALTPQAVAGDLDLARRQLEDGELHPSTTFELIAAIRAVMVRGQEDLIATGARRVADLEGQGGGRRGSRTGRGSDGTVSMK